MQGRPKKDIAYRYKGSRGGVFKGKTFYLFEDDGTYNPWFVDEEHRQTARNYGSIGVYSVTLTTIEEIPMNEYNVGDKLVHDDRSYHTTILGIVEHKSRNRTILVCEDSDDNCVRVIKTNDMEDWHKEPVVTELTLQEVAAKFNIPADKLRIKE